MPASIRGTIVRDGKAACHLLVECAECEARKRRGIVIDAGRRAVAWSVIDGTESDGVGYGDQAGRRTP